MTMTREKRVGLFRFESCQNAARGFTLVEVLTVAVLSLVIILAIGNIDVTRLLLSKDTRRNVASQHEAGLAAAYLTRSLVQADRVRLLDTSCAAGANPGGCIQLRVSTATSGNPADFDDPAKYRWLQYRYDSTAHELLFHNSVLSSGDCSGPSLTFTGISGLIVSYQDEAPAPPGGNPPSQDNNVVRFVVQPDVGLSYESEVTLRPLAYTNVGAVGTDSGTGQERPGANIKPPPPAPC